jgi:hypothetical protein
LYHFALPAAKEQKKQKGFGYAGYIKYARQKHGGTPPGDA